MNNNNPWKRLADAARRHQPDADTPAEMPLGFDTRVLARLKPPRRVAAELLGRLALDAIPVAADYKTAEERWIEARIAEYTPCSN